MHSNFRVLSQKSPRGYHAGMSTMPEHTDSARCNIELKARVASIDLARNVAKSLADRQLPDQHQIDTYFHCRHGRLKLREIVGERAELIAYRRPDESGTKASNYYLLPVDDPQQLKDALATTLGIRSRVEKKREIYLHKNVRIHLDRVEKLGEFLEFEAVLSDQHSAMSSQNLVEALRAKFEITANDLLQTSYGEMIESV